jgi:H+/Cl- antiporter ClcA
MSDTRSDFAADWRLLGMAAVAAPIGLVSTVAAFALLELIRLFTNIFFFQTFSFAAQSPALNHLGLWVIPIPVVGGLLIGLMARFGSEKIRGHGIPEAIEAILFGQSRMSPTVAVLKPLSSGIAIGSGGPFGAEGPIIMTGGAIGSLVGQLLRISGAERKALLVAGATAGMTAIFGTPLAAVMLAVELLLFELRPRSLLPVAIACAVAGFTRPYLFAAGPLFPLQTSAAPATVLLPCFLAGLASGCLSWMLSTSLYKVEDIFGRLPIHWMWWPAIGGLVVGIGGLIFPRALGVGYDTITDLLQGHVEIALLLGVLIVKPIIWATALGSGTSGGVLAPLLMMGAALGGVESHFLPAMGVGFWPLVSLGAILGGTMRSPFTGMLFAIELTHDTNMLLPLLVSCFAAHGFTVLTLRRSILTEKVARRGFHLSREYSVDPLELLRVSDVMRPDVEGALPGIVTYPEETLRTAVHRMAEHKVTHLAVTNRDDETTAIGVVNLEDLLQARTRNLQEERSRERVLGVGTGRRA